MHTTRVLRRGVVATALAAAAMPIVIASAAGATGAPPASPSSVAVTSSNRALNVSWTEMSTGTITFTATATATGHPTRSCRTKAHKCSIVSLVNGVTYAVTVVAANAAGRSAPSSPPATATAGVPGPPLSIHVKAATGAAAVNWAPPNASGVSAITGYAATATPGPFTCSTASTPTMPAARSCTIKGLTKGTTYTLSVTATNKYGTGPASKAATVTPK